MFFFVAPIFYNPSTYFFDPPDIYFIPAPPKKTKKFAQPKKDIDPAKKRFDPPSTCRRIYGWGDMVPRDNLPRDNLPRDNPPRRQSAQGDNMPRRQSALETTYPGDNLPRDNMPPRQCAPETTRPGDNMPRETICTGDYLPRFQNELLVLDYVRLG